MELRCPQCGAPFTRPAWRVRQAARTGATLHCGYDCAHGARRTRTPESRAEYHRQYREKNRAWINEKQKAARRENPERFIQLGRETYYRHLEKCRERARDYAAKHRDEAQARLKAWVQNNPERVRWHSVRSNIANQMGVKPSMVPDCVVDARIALLDLRRAILDAQGKSAGPTYDTGHPFDIAEFEVI